MHVAVIGAGRVGATVGGRWEDAGHEVVYGLRNPSKKEGAVSIPQALKGVEAVLLAIPGDAVVDFVQQHGKELEATVVIDATNNFRAPAMNCWAEIAPAVPRARLYRAFNEYGWDVLANPTIGGEQADLFYCGPEGPGKDEVERLIVDAGLRPVWIGGPDAAEVIDGVLRLWFTLSRTRGRRIAFKLLAD
jgi:8-hydroxy-5-deazaflavin:NADPH oxidoreductase